MTTDRLAKLLATLALCAASQSLLAGGEVYKCQKPDGKFEYRDTPCDKAATQKKVDTRGNVVETTVNPELAAKTRDMDQRIEQRQRQNAAAAEDVAIASARKYRYCQQYRDTIARQMPWLNSRSQVARDSAAAEIEIARGRLRDADC